MSKTRKTAAQKTAHRPEPRYKVGDKVRVSSACILSDLVGQTSTVRRVFWEDGDGGQKPGWVCETEMPFTSYPGMLYRCFWERILDPVENDYAQARTGAESCHWERLLDPVENQEGGAP